MVTMRKRKDRSIALRLNETDRALRRGFQLFFGTPYNKKSIAERKMWDEKRIQKR